MKIFTFAAVLLISTGVLAQESRVLEVSDTVRTFLDENGSEMSQLAPSCPTFESCSHMKYHRKVYSYTGDAQRAFDLLVSLRPNQIWHGSSRFELLYDNATQILLDKGDELPEIAVGQIFFLELDITKKMQIPVAFQVVELDREARSVSFSYLKQNKSNGIQKITFVDGGDKFEIVHETRFQSESKFRDNFLYGPFHTKLLNDAWKNFYLKFKSSH